MGPIILRVNYNFCSIVVTSDVCSPLQQIIIFAQERSAATIAGTPVPNVGRGIGMAFGLFALTVTASVCTHQVCKTLKTL
jgi:hypothetical protein